MSVRIRDIIIVVQNKVVKISNCQEEFLFLF